MRGGDPQERNSRRARTVEPPRPVILSGAKDLLRLLLHAESCRRANRVPGLSPRSPERDDPAKPDHKISAISFAPHQFTKLMEGTEGVRGSFEGWDSPDGEAAGHVRPELPCSSSDVTDPKYSHDNYETPGKDEQKSNI